MALWLEGIVLDADWSAPLSGVTVYAYNTEGYTEGSDTTDSNGRFLISGLNDKEWLAKLEPDTVGNILLVPVDPTPPEHRDVQGVGEDQHHLRDHFVEHHTGGDQALSLDLIAGTITASSHGDQENDALAVHSLMSDTDADTLIQLEEAADEDKIRFDTGGTQRAILDSNGLDTITYNITTGGQLIVDTDGDGAGSAGAITLGAGSDAGIYELAATGLVIENVTEDEDIIFSFDDGGVTKTITIDASINTVLFDNNSALNLGDGQITTTAGITAATGQFSNYLEFTEIAAPGADPAATKGWLYTKASGAVTKIYYEDENGDVTDLTAGAAGGQNLVEDTLWAAQGDLVYGTGDDAAAILTFNYEGDFLRLNATVPYWDTPGIADTNPVVIDGTANDNENAIFNAAGIEGLTDTELTANLDDVVGDAGAGGTKGLVPAPGAGDAAAAKYLKADATWAVPAIAGAATVALDNLAAVQVNTALIPDDDGVTHDLGATGERWKDIYFVGDLKDDTTSLSVADLKGPTRTIVLTAAGGAPTTTSGCSEPTKNEIDDVDHWSLDFATDADEYAFWNIIMPENWDGSTVTASFTWTATGGAGTVDWVLAGQAFGEGDPIDSPWTDIGEHVTDTLTVADDVHQSSSTAAITINGTPGGGDYVIFRVMRDISADNLGQDAKLLGIKIKYGTNAYEDVT